MAVFAMRDIPADIWEAVKRRARLEAAKTHDPERLRLASIMLRLLRCYAVHGIEAIERACPPVRVKPSPPKPEGDGADRSDPTVK